MRSTSLMPQGCKPLWSSEKRGLPRLQPNLCPLRAGRPRSRLPRASLPESAWFGVPPPPLLPRWRLREGLFSPRCAAGAANAGPFPRHRGTGLFGRGADQLCRGRQRADPQARSAFVRVHHPACYGKRWPPRGSPFSGRAMRKDVAWRSVEETRGNGMEIARTNAK
jgi:hypothetical protein